MNPVLDPSHGHVGRVQERLVSDHVGVPANISISSGVLHVELTARIYILTTRIFISTRGRLTSMTGGRDVQPSLPHSYLVTGTESGFAYGATISSTTWMRSMVMNFRQLLSTYFANVPSYLAFQLLALRWAESGTRKIRSHASLNAFEKCSPPTKWFLTFFTACKFLQYIPEFRN